MPVVGYISPSHSWRDCRLDRKLGEDDLREPRKSVGYACHNKFSPALRLRRRDLPCSTSFRSIRESFEFGSMKTIQPVSTNARARNGIVLSMFALSVLSYVDRTALSIAGPTLIKEFGFSETQMGSVYSVFLLSYALFMFPGGWLADRYGPRLVLALTSMGSALFTAL